MLDTEDDTCEEQRKLWMNREELDREDQHEDSYQKQRQVHWYSVELLDGINSLDWLDDLMIQKKGMI